MPINVMWGKRMNSKQRVYAAIKGQHTDRIPIFMWYSDKTADKLAGHLSVDKEIVDDVLCNDIKQDWLSINKQMSLQCPDKETFVDEFGITWQRDGEYNTPIVHPLAESEVDDIAAYPMPDPLKPERYALLNKLMDTYPDKFIGADVSGSIFEPSYHLRGMDNVLVDMMLDNPEADVLFDRMTDFTRAVALKALSMGVDWIWLGDDFGTQQSTIASPDLWRKYLKPRIKSIIDSLKAARPDVIIAFHSCGSIYPLIEDLYDIGVRVINPLQESAAGIDHKRIRDEYPDMTMFCGLDTQQYLLSASPDDVYRRSIEKIESLSRNGHYIFGSSHTIQHDVPVENILAMIKAAVDYGEI